MKKKERQLFTSYNFDNVAYARDVLEAEKEKLERVRSRMPFAIFIIVLNVLMELFISGYETYPILNFVLSAAISILPWICYISVSLKSVFSVIGNVVSFVWYMIPIFPIDIVAAFIALGLCLTCLTSIPVIPLLIVKRQCEINVQGAENYLDAVIQLDAGRKAREMEEMPHFCSSCGTSLSGNEIFCPVCGNQVQ